MSGQPLLTQPSRVDEPQAAHEYADVLSQVAREGRQIIVCRNGTDLAAVIPVQHLELMREVVARQDLEARAAQLKWEKLLPMHRPPQLWFNDDDNPFEPEEDAAS